MDLWVETADGVFDTVAPSDPGHFYDVAKSVSVSHASLGLGRGNDPGPRRVATVDAFTDQGSARTPRAASRPRGRCGRVSSDLYCNPEPGARGSARSQLREESSCVSTSRTPMSWRHWPLCSSWPAARAYAANTVFSTDIVNGEVKSVDIGTGQVQSTDVKNEGLTGADIANQSGVDTCVLTQRIGSLCARAENFARTWREARGHCANLDLRVPTLGEADSSRRPTTFRMSIRPSSSGPMSSAPFPTTPGAVSGLAFVVDDAGASALGPTNSGDKFETVCVMTPTN